MTSLDSMTDAEPPLGDFDPSNAKELDRLLHFATIRYGERLALLPASQRDEVLTAAQFGAIEAALTYDPGNAKTTKWKTAANRANTVVRRFFRELPRQPQNETDVLERVRRHNGIADADPEGDAGELDLTVLAADDDDDYADYDDERDGLSDDEWDAILREEEELLGASDDDEAVVFVEPTEAELHPLLRAPDEDAEHFEMRRHLITQVPEPDRTILREWTLAAPEVGQMVGISGDAVRQRKTRLRRLINSEIARPGPLSTPDQ